MLRGGSTVSDNPTSSEELESCAAELTSPSEVVGEKEGARAGADFRLDAASDVLNLDAGRGGLKA